MAGDALWARLSGKVSRNRGPHLRRLLGEAPRALLDGLAGQVGGRIVELRGRIKGADGNTAMGASGRVLVTQSL